jgi:hypothetical protein
MAILTKIDGFLLFMMTPILAATHGSQPFLYSQQEHKIIGIDAPTTVNSTPG